MFCSVGLLVLFFFTMQMRKLHLLDNGGYWDGISRNLNEELYVTIESKSWNVHRFIESFGKTTVYRVGHTQRSLKKCRNKCKFQPFFSDWVKCYRSVNVKYHTNDNCFRTEKRLNWTKCVQNISSHNFFFLLLFIFVLIFYFYCCYYVYFI